jgi:hypothetical protein
VSAEAVSSRAWGLLRHIVPMSFGKERLAMTLPMDFKKAVGARFIFLDKEAGKIIIENDFQYQIGALCL